MTQLLPPAFKDAIRNFESYPENLIYRTTYQGVLRTSRERLDDIKRTLFVTKDANVNVPFRDLLDSGLGLSLSCLVLDNVS